MIVLLLACAGLGAAAYDGGVPAWIACYSGEVGPCADECRAEYAEARAAHMRGQHDSGLAAAYLGLGLAAAVSIAAYVRLSHIFAGRRRPGPVV